MEILHKCKIQLIDNTVIHIDTIVIKSLTQSQYHRYISNDFIRDKVIEHLGLHIQSSNKSIPINTIFNKDKYVFIFTSAMNNYTETINTLQKITDTTEYFQNVQSMFQTLNTRGKCIFGIIYICSIESKIKQDVGIISYGVLF
jgi:hypothetical protein